MLKKLWSGLTWGFDKMFKALGLHDGTKRALLVVTVVAVIEFPLAALQSIQIYQWVKRSNNPHAEFSAKAGTTPADHGAAVSSGGK